MNSRASRNTYSDLRDNIWMPTEETLARLQRLEQLQALREGRTSQESENETGQRVSARERFLQSYNLPSWGRGGVEHQIGTGLRSVSITRENRRNTLPELPAMTTFRPSVFDQQPDVVYEEPMLSQEEVTASYTPLAMYSEELDGDDYSTQKSRNSSRAAFIDSRGKAHWIEPYNPVLRGYVSLENIQEYIESITRSMQPKIASELKSLLMQWHSDKAVRRKDVEGRLSPEGQYDDDHRGTREGRGSTSSRGLTSVLQKSQSVDDLSSTSYKSERPPDRTSSSTDATDRTNVDHDMSENQNPTENEEPKVVQSYSNQLRDNISTDRITRRAALLERNDSRSRRSTNIRRHISDVSGMHPTRIAGLYRGRSVLPDSNWNDSSSQQRGQENGVSRPNTEETLMEGDETESNSQPSSPRRYISRAEIPSPRSPSSSEFQRASSMDYTSKTQSKQ